MKQLKPQGRGAAAEQLALNYLQQQGLSPIARNYRCRQGELDLIMQQADTLVFVEVKYRQRSDYGLASEAVDRDKQQRMILTAQHFLQSHPRYGLLACRFDVVSISGQQNRLEWLTNAFDAS